MRGFIDALNGLALTPQQIAGGLVLLVVVLMALVLARWALSGGR